MFDKSIPGMQRVLYEEVLAELQRLDVRSGRIAVTVRNLSIVDSIKRKLNRIILTDEYKQQVREFARAYNEITKLQTEFWRTIEPQFKPRPLLKALRNQAVDDIVNQMTNRVQVSIGDALTDILRTNITAGGSYAELAEQMRLTLLNTPGGKKGLLDSTIKTISTTSINQFNRQYTNIVASDLGYVWFRYANTEIMTSRPFCQAMVENHRYFHISQVPELLQGKYLGVRMEYVDNKTGETKKVELGRNGLPAGFIEGTNVDNFFINAGGWNCGHSINPVAEQQVPVAVREAIKAMGYYKAWERAQ